MVSTCSPRHPAAGLCTSTGVGRRRIHTGSAVRLYTWYFVVHSAPVKLDRGVLPTLPAPANMGSITGVLRACMHC